MEVLRMTSSQSGSPDNEMGYGVIDAWAALKYRSVTGVVRLSSSSQPLPDYSISIIMGDSIYQTVTNSSGWFAFCPGELGPFTISQGTGEGSVIPVSGTLGVDGLELEVFVDQEPGNSPPSAFPNPSTEGVWVGFDLLEGPADVSMSVFDLMGRQVFRYDRSDLAPGSYRAPLPGEAFYWDGNCDDGSRASSGVYIISLRLGESVHLIKCALVR
jgi:hypothetical protein